MFYPLRNLDDIKLKGSYWKLFRHELQLHREDKPAHKCTLWPDGFVILQNIQDRMTMDKDVKRAEDYITATTTNEAPLEEENRMQNPGRDNLDDLDDILKFCSKDR